MVFRLAPYQANLRKRLTRTPKLYFYDTGLLCHLLGLDTFERLRDSPHRGSVFENQVILETMKQHVNAGREPRLRFYRDDSKTEVDLVDLTDAASPELVEVKSSRTFSASFLKGVTKVGDLLGVPVEHRHVVMRADATHAISGVRVWNAEDWLLRRA